MHATVLGPLSSSPGLAPLSPPSKNRQSKQSYFGVASDRTSGLYGHSSGAEV